MKTKTKSFFKIMSAALLVFALAFTTNMDAGNRGKKWGQQKVKKEKIQNFQKDKRSNDKPSYDQHSNDKPSYDGRSKDQGSCEPGDNIPLDGGLSILLIGAAAFGVKKLRKNKNEEI